MHSWQHTGVVHMSLQADGKVLVEEIPVFGVCRPVCHDFPLYLGVLVLFIEAVVGIRSPQQRLTNSDNAIVAATVSSCRISSNFWKRWACRVYIIHGTRRLNLSSNLHTVCVGLIPLCLCDNCCIVYLYIWAYSLNCCLA